MKLKRKLEDVIADLFRGGVSMEDLSWAFHITKKDIEIIIRKYVRD